MLKYSKFRKKIWESSTLSSRVISWILNIDIIINNGTFEFKKNFFQSIVSQCNHLKRNIQFEKDYKKKIEILSALLLFGLAFKELNKTKSGGTPYGASHVENFNSSTELSRDEYEIAKKSGVRLAKLINKINV